MCEQLDVGTLARRVGVQAGEATTSAARATAGDAAGRRNFGPMPIGVGTGAAAIATTARA